MSARNITALRKIGTLALCMTMALSVMTGCSSAPAEEAEAEPVPITAENIAPGVFTQHLDCEEIATKLTGSYSIGAREEFFYEDNTLILTNNSDPNRSKQPDAQYKDTSTPCRYELIKEMYIANRGFIHYQAYFGTYVLNEEDQTVTLNLPEYSYSYVWSGDNIATNPKAESYSDHLIGTKEGDDPTKGFANEYYNTQPATQPQQVRINLNDNTFSFVSVFEADDA